MGRSNLDAHRCANRLSSSRGTILTSDTPGSRFLPWWFGPQRLPCLKGPPHGLVRLPLDLREFSFFISFCRKSKFLGGGRCRAATGPRTTSKSSRPWRAKIADELHRAPSALAVKAHQLGISLRLKGRSDHSSGTLGSGNTASHREPGRLARSG